MDKKLSGDVFDDAIVPFTDAILMLMFWSSISGSDFLFGCPVFESSRFEFSTGISM